MHCQNAGPGSFNFAFVVNFYIFIQLGADTVINSLHAATPEMCTKALFVEIRSRSKNQLLSS